MNTGLRQFLSFERKQNKTLCSTVSLFHVTSSQDLTWIMWSLIFSSILIHKILEGKKFVFMCIIARGQCQSWLVRSWVRCHSSGKPKGCVLLILHAGSLLGSCSRVLWISVLVSSPPLLCHKDPECWRAKIQRLVVEEESVYGSFLQSCAESLLEWLILACEG